MTGAALDAFLLQRLAQEGVQDERFADPDARYRLLTSARDEVRREIALAAGVALRTWVTLQRDAGEPRRYSLPIGMPDPLRFLSVRVPAGRELAESFSEGDGGIWMRETLRSVLLAPGLASSAGLQAGIVYMDNTVLEFGFADDEIGLPSWAHDCIVYKAAILALTANEHSDAGNAVREYTSALNAALAVAGSHDRSTMGALQKLFRMGDEPPASTFFL